MKDENNINNTNEINDINEQISYEEFISSLIDKCKMNYHIKPEEFTHYQIKRGLRNSDGTGVLAGITGVGLVHGYVVSDGEKLPVDGKLYYWGYNVEDLIDGYIRENRYGFEECSYLLLFGELPTKHQLEDYQNLLNSYRKLPPRFTEDVIMKAPTANIMNKIASSILSLYAYDDNPDDISLENVFRQCMFIITSIPIIAAQAYAVKRHIFDDESFILHNPLPNLSTAQNFLRIVRPDGQYTEEEARLLDLCLVLHAEHGGGNNSTFACRVLTSSDTDTYSAVSAAVGSLKGPKHGGANLMVQEMTDFIKDYVKNWDDKEEVKQCLLKILKKEVFDKKGLIYGMGHAVYTYSDPRAMILKKYARRLAMERGFIDEFNLLEKIEELTPRVFAEFKGNDKGICANVDLYSGLVYNMLGIPRELHTPLFVISRAAGWCAHRIEELLTGGKIIRPGYKTLSARKQYIPIEKR